MALLRRMDHNQTYSELCVTLIQPYATAVYSESWLSENLRHIQKPVKHLR